MKVSIIIPVYNSEKYIDRCLKSVINQSYRNIEVVVIDNGSKDMSVKIIKNYFNKDNRIKLYFSKTKGASVARNIGLEKATGDYALFIDSDDYVSEDYVEKMIKVIKNDKKTMVLCNNKEIWNNRIDERKLFKEIGTKSLEKEVVIKEIAIGNAGLVCSKLIDLKVVKDNNILFDRNIKLSEDLLFFLEVTNYTEEFIYLDESLYFYDRRNEKSITRRYIDNAWDNNMYLLDKVKEIISKSNLSENEKESIIYNRLKQCISFAISNEVDNIKFNNYRIRIKNIKKIINKNIYMKEIEKSGYTSFQEKFMISGVKSVNKSIWIIQLLFIFKVIFPIKNKISSIRGWINETVS